MKTKAYCIAFGCLNNNKDPKLTFFTLPKDIERRQKWLTLIDRDDLLQKEDLKRSSHLVCSAHFEDSSIKTIKHLKENALPSMLLHNQPQEGSSCSETQSTSARMKGKDKGKEFILSNNKEYVTVGTQTESLQSTEQNAKEGIKIKIKAKTYCIAFGCLNNNKDPNLAFFTLPKDIERCQKWLTLIDREDLLQKEDLKRSSHLVCSAHFEDSSIKTIKHLKDNALPSMLLHNQPQGSSCSETQSTSARLKGKGKDNAIILSNDKEYVSVGKQTESLQSMENQAQTSKLIVEKRKLSNKIRECKLKRLKLEQEISKIKKE